MAAKNPKQTKERMIHVRLSEAMHKTVRIRAAEADKTIQDWVLRAIQNELTHSESKKKAGKITE
ncbi:toxin-antitoxin system HicB family antitoxin [Dehalococcoides mccartyi]|uniref:toxin-antitoxin system HicB family antitoxin n=1 Tax=Dehalococcoides mccartyi TaxID=61435 RepID=UPI0003C860F5|nr:toxin-antitoxin system HicB family antitoxin [Dehalococcoides mccartyi]AHB13472.1 hypothetical protein GY50_0691 [Dehalococcoides mccartyi GY50]